MDRSETTLGKLEIFFGGATVFSAFILLGVIAFNIRPEILSPVVGLGVVVLLLALVVGAGVWSSNAGSDSGRGSPPSS